MAATVSLVGSLLGPIWMFSPANAETLTPDSWLTFSDLTSATAQSPSAIQAAYFGWLAWTLIASIVLVTIGATITGFRPLFLAEATLGLAALVVTVFALKGPSTWGAVVAALPDIRIGGYMVIAGLLLLVVHGSTAARDTFRSSQPGPTL
ncbi:hypothetical protein CJ179_49910 [Rhodococcus sp. ACS1]|uniref:hypothetical protein n=1 Tax=Rhodococcus sp. ACS1 TaxID=2028570 RepID=UPI000BB157B5|nr:hypothetical protein [Rhodococcus sp. ACS1]PBC35076.1 hypothetical protein CJ179_49910 [Rhodococcus sp. ACS1]